MTITLDTNDLSDLLFRASVAGSNRALEKAGMLDPFITSSEIKKMKGGVSLFEAARLDSKIKWMPVGKGGRTSGVYCLRVEFEKFLFNREFEFNRK